MEARQTAARPMTGSATAESAIVLPSVIAIAGLILAMGRVVIVSMDCQGAATAATRVCGYR